ncbi:MAG: TonB-dependent receptor [Deltaproteobacteria bacterium HGW-Deltaproteobacteria-24]|nr:MAG: TonB-dependent receptor [Deltaproteobacteria bacterium HGW-Deltaproteobacteria-24]
MKKSMLFLSLATSVALAQSYNLGQVSVQANTADEMNMFEQTISSKDVSRDNALTVQESLDNLSGISQDMQGGRGESTLYIRGFDAKRVGVFIDGIPIYVPYDGNFDYGRFLTADIGQIDVSKGYSSVVYGGNTMGGVVNIVSKKPSKEFEGNIKGEIVLDSNGKQARHIESINLGTMQSNGFYAQMGASYSKQDHFRISDDYQGTTEQPAGERLRCETEDKKASFKMGYVAHDKSEIAISYSNQKGVKQQPPVSDTTFAKVKYWDWPYWDKETISVVGQKNFENSYIKALAYYDTSENSLYSYANNTYSTFTAAGSNFKSRYDDYSYGARLEYGIELEEHFIKAAANYKKDVHKGYDINKFTNAETLTENYEDNTISLGIENTYTITSNLELLAGVSYDRKEADKIYDTNTAFLNMLALETQSSFSPQVALVYALDESSKLRGSISQKTYMPSMKDRYSRRLGSAAPNPELDNETATHYELSYQKQYQAFVGGVTGFFTRVDDAIQSVTYAPDPTLNQNQNVGSFDHKGVEFDLSYTQDDIKVGGNYTYISIKNKEDNSVKIVDVPRHQLFLFAQKELGAGVSVYGNMKIRKGAYENKLDGSYVINPTMTTFDVKAIYEATSSLTAQIGIKNLTDELIRYDMAYPMAGREFFASLEYKF